MLHLYRLLLITVITLITLATTVTAQKRSVLVEPQKRKINQDAPLPAQAYFNIQVPVSSETGIVQVNIYKGKNTNDLFEQAYWVRPVNFAGDFAELPIDSKLKSNSNYSFQVTIYNQLGDSQRVRLHQLLHRHIDNYLDAILQTDNNRLDLARKPTQVMVDLNLIVNKSLSGYRNLQNKSFEGFSETAQLKMQQVENARMKNAAYNIDKAARDSAAGNETDVTFSYASQLRNQLDTVLFTELDNYLDLDFVAVYDSFVVKNQFTERTQAVLPLFVGYGAVYFSGNVRNLEYDSKPYAGFSIPLGRGDGKYFSRTTFIMGIFLSNFKDGNDSTLTGPIVDRPVFAGLGFRVFDFINFNAGMVATSSTKQNLSNIKTENIKLYPFIGLNFQFNLWLGVNKK